MYKRYNLFKKNFRNKVILFKEARSYQIYKYKYFNQKWNHSDKLKLFIIEPCSLISKYPERKIVFEHRPQSKTQNDSLVLKKFIGQRREFLKNI